MNAKYYECHVTLADLRPGDASEACNRFRFKMADVVQETRTLPIATAKGKDYAELHGRMVGFCSVVELELGIRVVRRKIEAIVFDERS